VESSLRPQEYLGEFKLPVKEALLPGHTIGDFCPPSANGLAPEDFADSLAIRVRIERFDFFLLRPEPGGAPEIADLPESMHWRLRRVVGRAKLAFLLLAQLKGLHGRPVRIARLKVRTTLRVGLERRCEEAIVEVEQIERLPPRAGL